MLLDLVHLYGAEGAKTNVEGNLAVSDALGFYLFDQLIGEMQTRGGSSGRALLLGIDGLIIVLVFKLLCNVGRQGHISYRVKHLIDALIFFFIVLKGDDTVSIVQNLGYGGSQNSREIKACSDASALTRADEGFPASVLSCAQKQKLNGGAGLKGGAKKSCRNNLRGVNNKHILGAQVIYNISENLVADLTALSINGHKTAHIALFARELGNKLLGQIIIKIMSGQLGVSSCVIYLYMLNVHKQPS